MTNLATIVSNAYNIYTLVTIMAGFDEGLISIDLGIQINNCTFVLAN